ncbi:GGDEF domain-containing protein [Marinobacterium lutimaris]|uniref:diguanylate cyclase n=1 Tax=Marinobacterium lutimaris TaxID=568106 RepID=A0A1H5UH45_9GAMM|nr:GGDEF domain-containing protein [Marinobacterium lutimaris]SEF74339.1 diguanylate cyclase (GGDEF) domain-containing protein [Marinobacterium lutimaris]
MSQDVSASAGRFDALLQVNRDLVLVLKDGVVELCSAGESEWLLESVLTGGRLDDLLPADILALVSGAVERALAAPGQVQSLQYALRPEHVPVFREAGLREPTWFDARILASADGEVFWSARDINDSKKLQRKVTNQAQRDPLTGAYNRRALMTVMEQTVAQAQRYDWVCSVMIIDIDDFSRINDQHGWDAGDQLLQQIVTGIHKLKRTADFLARYGDDQLVLFLPETNHEQGVAAGERVRRLIAEMEMPYPTGDIACTASVGVSGLLGLEDGAAAMLKRAEENLFVARSSGGNRVEGESL